MKKLIISLLAVTLMFTACGPKDAEKVKNTEETAHSEFDILLAAENIDEAHFLYFYDFIAGNMATGGEQLSEYKNPYPQTTYYAHMEDCDTVDELKDLACTYFSEEVFENSFMSEFEPKCEGTPPYLIEVDGIIYNNLNYGVGGKVIFMHETAEITELKDNTAIVTMQYYNAIDETLKETTTVEMVYENDRWVFNQAFLLKKYE